MTEPSLAGPGCPFVHTHRVTYAECTVGDHIYYGRYLELLEAARGAFFRHTGSSLLNWQHQDFIFPVVECHLRYKRPARYDDVLQIQLWITAAQGVRLNFGYRISNEAGELVLEGETWHACTSVAGKPRRLPGQLLTALEPYSKTADPGFALFKPA